MSARRRLALGAAVALVVLVALAAVLLRDGGENGTGEGDPEAVALAYMAALDAKDYGAMWDNASSYERDGRSRQAFIDGREANCADPCESTVPEGTTYEVTYARADDQWLRVGIRRQHPDRSQPEDEEVVLVEEDGRYGAVEAGPPGFDPNE